MQTETLIVTGMTCGGCVDIVTRALLEVDGVQNVNVSLENGEAKVDFDEVMTTLENIVVTVQVSGFGATEKIVY